jgi:tetratricopeptide (TPR) repeat protein
MVKTNPIEKVFIGLVEKIVEDIFRDNVSDEECTKILKTLNSHLEKARQLNFLSYEGEVLNALALYELMNGGSSDLAMKGFYSTYDCALRANNIELQAKALSNIGSLFNEKFDFAEAKIYIDRVIELGKTVPPVPLSCLFAYGNRINYHITQGDWNSAHQDILVANDLSGIVHVTSATRNDYARSITTVRIREVMINLVQGDYTAALTALRLAQGLTSQLNSSEYNLQVALVKIFYTLIVDENTEAFNIWHHTQRYSTNIELLENIVEVAFLQKMKHIAYAKQVAEFVLDNAPTEQAKAKIQSIFEELGVTLV